MELFDEKDESLNTGQPRPLAERMRPEKLNDIIGQNHLVGENSPIRVALQKGYLPSMILWGPPGSGKTTIASVIARQVEARFIFLSAVSAGIKDARRIVTEAEREWQHYHRQVILFIDEIHRFNKAQQDFFLPYVEKGVIILIGATTENPSFEVISPLLSRCQVFTLNRLGEDHIVKLLKRAITDEKQGVASSGVKLGSDILTYLANLADGDARRALSYLDLIVSHFSRHEKSPGLEEISQVLQKKTLIYDKSGEEHYNLISALHKSIRGSDPDAALYWLARMLESGEDPLYLARRLVRMAVEDIGLSDPAALNVALNARDAFRFLGSPEGDLALAECAVYLATAPKSNRIYSAFKRARKVVSDNPSEPVPLHIRNAPTRLMKEMGYGEGYKYAHNYDNAYAVQEYLPDRLRGEKFYHPSEIGFEKKIAERIKWWEAQKNPPDEPEST
jgi:putative ATPase